MVKFLVFGGKTGWIGQKMVVMLREKGYEVVVAETRLENIQDVRALGWSCCRYRHSNRPRPMADYYSASSALLLAVVITKCR